MKKSFKGLFSLILVIALIASLFTFTSAAAVSRPDANPGYRDQICTSLSSGAKSYYSTGYDYATLSNLSASALKTELSTLMKETHESTSSYANCRDYAPYTDCEGGDSSKFRMLYTSYAATYSQYKGGSGWNREHVWPQSSGGGNTSGGGADLHHIRPSESNINNTRGNKVYGNASGGKTTNGGTLSGLSGGKYNEYFEPHDNVKGDVARICLYVYVRWGTDWGATSITDVFQSVDVLLEWCEMDPVDTWEMGRNDVVEDVQGNRNVFIDYPEYAWLIFGEEVPSDMQTPSGMAKEGNTGSGNTGGNQGGTTGGNQGGTTGGSQGGSVDGPCTHTKYELINEVISCTDMGYSGDKKCLDCGEVFEMGDYTFPSGEHTVGEIISDEGGKKFYVCATCGEGVYETSASEDASWIESAFDAIVVWFESVFEWLKNIFKS